MLWCQKQDNFQYLELSTQISRYLPKNFRCLMTDSSYLLSSFDARMSDLRSERDNYQELLNCCKIPFAQAEFNTSFLFLIPRPAAH